ncbi:hypothetical protein Tco_0938838 [Tanacetum coccineum]|uniref:Uncharacterized protein n=1 Tax=Tanacetum coccineum TaxID=301880 RepID=A0ABQ5DK44_9ASTR
MKLLFALLHSPSIRLENQSTTSQDIHTHKIYTIGSTQYLNHTNTQDKYNRGLVLRRKEERSLINTSFLDEYECFSLALEEEEIRSLETRSKKVVRRFEDEHVDGMEKLELLFEQDIDVEKGRFEGDEDGGEV